MQLNSDKHQKQQQQNQVTNSQTHHFVQPKGRFYCNNFRQKSQTHITISDHFDLENVNFLVDHDEPMRVFR